MFTFHTFILSCDKIGVSPVALLQEVAFLLAAKLLVALQLVHAVAALLALRVLQEPRAPLSPDRVASGRHQDAEQTHNSSNNTKELLL